MFFFRLESEPFPSINSGSFQNVELEKLEWTFFHVDIGSGHSSLSFQLKDGQQADFRVQFNGYPSLKKFLFFDKSNYSKLHTSQEWIVDKDYLRIGRYIFGVKARCCEEKIQAVRLGVRVGGKGQFQGVLYLLVFGLMVLLLGLIYVCYRCYCRTSKGFTAIDESEGISIDLAELNSPSNNQGGNVDIEFEVSP